MASDATFDLMEGGFLMRKSEKKSPYFIGSSARFLNLHFPESSHRIRQLGYKTEFLFFGLKPHVMGRL